MERKKVIILILDIVIGVYLLMAMTAFNTPDETSSNCVGVKINISEESVEGLLSVTEVNNILLKSRIFLKGQPMHTINTRQIEETLEGNDLIECAECYKTQGGHVCIDIKQRIPVIRIMAANGDDYYVDNHGEIMPHTNYACDLIVATGQINKVYASRVLAPMARVVLADKFWRNQVVQFNIQADGGVELVPRVGEHIAYLGQPTGISRKLNRLQKFYLYGLNKAGWNRYSQVSVEFDNQIICKRRPRSSR